MEGYFLLFLIRFLYENMFVQAGHSALCFLTIQPVFETLQFAKQLAQDGIQYGVDVYIMIDDNNSNFSSSHIQFLTISKDQCLSHGYRKTTHLGIKKTNIVSWDKALFYFSVLNKNYSFVWFIENDVFIPSVQSFRSIHQLYSNISDLVISANEINLLGNTSSWHWSKIVGRLSPPWSNSMVNVVGLSKRMLEAIDDDIQWRGISAFHEFFFPTLAMQLNMTIIKPFELSTLKYRQKISWKQIYEQPNNLWHPVKEPIKRDTWRKQLATENLERKFIIKLTDLEILYNNNENIANIEEYLTNLLANFTISKGELSSNDRRLMRQYFINLAERYVKQNKSKQVILLTQNLAEHAYKSPEFLITLFQQKSSYHLKLEQALKKNKQAIFHLLSTKSDSSLVNELRDIATNLTRELTLEIKKEAKVLQNKNQFIPFTRKIHNFSFLFPSNNFSSTYKSNTFCLFQKNHLKKLLLISYTLIIILRFGKLIKQKFFIYSIICFTFFFLYFIQHEKNTLI